jgi:DNA-directed RNA polymerase specialized sigma subunit
MLCDLGYFSLDTRRALERLTEREQACIWWLCVAGETQAETAHRMGICQQRVGQIRDRALVELRRAMG